MMRRRLLLLPLLAVLLGGCQLFTAGTRVEEVSSAAPTPATLRKLLLVGVTTSPEMQAAMERAFARELDRTGRTVVLASEWFPGEKEPLREDVVQRVKAEGVTGVLVVRLVGYEAGELPAPEPAFSLKTPARVPGERVGWDQGAGPDALAPPPLPQRKALLETRLHDVATGQVVWRAQSRTLLRADADKELDGFVHAILLALRRSGWLPVL